LGGDRRTATADLVAYARALASVDVWSLEHVAAYEAARRRHGVGEETRAWRASAIAAQRDRFVAVVGELGVDARGISSELDELEAILDGGRYAGVVHGDPCPDNVWIIDGECRIFDFEKTGRGSIALDAAYVLAPFPTCWCFARLPADVASPALAAYGEVLDRAGVDTGEAWQRALAAALSVSVIGRSDQLARALQEDERWGTAPMRPRFLAWIDSFVAAATDADAFPRVRALHVELGDRLRSAWPDTVVPEYPAFAEPGSVRAEL
jgi:Ser/Thr protein kinase RdoA (MazF antagonist)